jgi:hypothetical protein
MTLPLFLLKSQKTDESLVEAASSFFSPTTSGQDTHNTVARVGIDSYSWQTFLLEMRLFPGQEGLRIGRTHPRQIPLYRSHLARATIPKHQADRLAKVMHSSSLT